MPTLDLVDTIAIVMLENRSFDHMLGHLSVPPFATGVKVDGLLEPLDQDAYLNIDASGEPYYPFVMRDGKLATDLPHERDFVATQLGWSSVAGRYMMDGFVRAYYQFQSINRPAQPDPMGFLAPADVPITHFLAQQYAVCDRWHASLPASTQPNRLMALSGDSEIDYTKGLFPPTGDLYLDWLSKRNVSWRVYHSGISFFALLGRIPEIFGPNYRYIDHLAIDVKDEARGAFPSVIIIEPSFGDAPHIGSDVPNDNHPPLAVGPGEAFLRQVYEALTCNPDRWSRTLLIVTYDEHGGFYDHVPPPPIDYTPPPGNQFLSGPFTSMGVRVPALVVSPLVSSQSVYHGLLDHTSILQLLAEKFDPKGKGFSASVNQRKAAGIGSVSQVLDLAKPRTDIPDPPPAPSQSSVSFAEPQGATSPMQQGFHDAAMNMIKRDRTGTADKYPEILHWALMQVSNKELSGDQPTG
jgi:phospholipase C